MTARRRWAGRGGEIGRVAARLVQCAAGTAAFAGCASTPSVHEVPDAAVACPGTCALEFNGTTDYAIFANEGLNAQNSPQTISFWARAAAPDAGTEVVIGFRRDQVSGLNIGITQGAWGAWTFYGQRTLVRAPTAADPGVWHHVAYVLDQSDAGGTLSTLYIDGTAVATSTVTPDNRTPVWAWVGSPDGLGSFYAGDLGQLRVWNVARTADEVLADMNGTTDASTPGLVAYFDFGVVVGTLVPDQSSEGNDMSLGGGSTATAPALVPATLPTSSP